MARTSSYIAPIDEITDMFGEYLEGDTSRPAVVVSSRRLSDSGRKACELTFDSFGFEPSTCSFVALSPEGSSAGGPAELDSSALFLLIESLDPLFVVSTDSAATSTLAHGYRLDLPLDGPARVFGRQAVCFTDFASLLETQEGKRKAWGILKALKQ